jgi:hypothetical protein
MVTRSHVFLAKQMGRTKPGWVPTDQLEDFICSTCDELRQKKEKETKRLHKPKKPGLFKYSVSGSKLKKIKYLLGALPVELIDDFFPDGSLLHLRHVKEIRDKGIQIHIVQRYDDNDTLSVQVLGPRSNLVVGLGNEYDSVDEIGFFTGGHDSGATTKIASYYIAGEALWQQLMKVMEATEQGIPETRHTKRRKSDPDARAKAKTRPSKAKAKPLKAKAKPPKALYRTDKHGKKRLSAAAYFQTYGGIGDVCMVSGKYKTLRLNKNNIPAWYTTGDCALNCKV